MRTWVSAAATCENVHVVLHQAALGSVPRSLADPLATNATNVEWICQHALAARKPGVARFVYAASSSTYGDEPALPKVEERIGRPLSPYAVTKLVDELYAEVFSRCYGMEHGRACAISTCSGARQDPEGAYAAVIPRWIRAMLRGEHVVINGDGETSRDFCYVENAVQANLLAATVTESAAVKRVFNVALNERTTFNDLFVRIRDEIARFAPGLVATEPIHADFRAGDVRHSQADISKARRLLGYEPTHALSEGLRAAMPWYVEHLTTMQPVRERNSIARGSAACPPTHAVWTYVPSSLLPPVSRAFRYSSMQVAPIPANGAGCGPRLRRTSTAKGCREIPCVPSSCTARGQLRATPRLNTTSAGCTPMGAGSIAAKI